MASVRSIQREREKIAVAALPNTITVKLKDLVNSAFALQELAAQPMKAKVTFQFGKMLRAVNQEMEDYEKARKTLCEKHGTLVADENRYDIRVPEKFNEELEELLTTDVTLNVPPIQLGLIENTPMTSAAMMVLSWLIVE